MLCYDFHLVLGDVIWVITAFAWNKFKPAQGCKTQTLLLGPASALS